MNGSPEPGYPFSAAPVLVRLASRARDGPARSECDCFRAPEGRHPATWQAGSAAVRSTRLWPTRAYYFVKYDRRRQDEAPKPGRGDTRQSQADAHARQGGEANNREHLVPLSDAAIALLPPAPLRVRSSRAPLGLVRIQAGARSSDIRPAQAAGAKPNGAWTCRSQENLCSRSAQRNTWPPTVFDLQRQLCIRLNCQVAVSFAPFAAQAQNAGWSQITYTERLTI